MPKTPTSPSKAPSGPQKPSKAELKRQVDALHAQLHPTAAPPGAQQAPASLDGFLNLVRPFLLAMSKAKLLKIVSIILDMESA